MFGWLIFPRNFNKNSMAQKLISEYERSDDGNVLDGINVGMVLIQRYGGQEAGHPGISVSPGGFVANTRWILDS
jgi:hypothetical protein